MHILLAAATPFEIQPTIDYLATTPFTGKGPGNGPGGGSGIETSQGSALTWEPVITGIGSLATGWALMRQIGTRRPDLIIQAGIAGCFTGRKAGDVVAVQDETLADLGVWEDQRFKSPFDLKLADGDTLPFSGGRLVNPYHRLLRLTALDAVSAITINEISTDSSRISWYQQNTAAVVESMEGGALHFVCLQERIPFVQLRSVSNDIGVRDKAKWDIRTAIQHLNEHLILLLTRLSQAGPAVFEL